MTKQMVIMLIIVGVIFGGIFGYMGFQILHDEKIHVGGRRSGGHGIGQSLPSRTNGSRRYRRWAACGQCAASRWPMKLPVWCKA